MALADLANGWRSRAEDLARYAPAAAEAFRVAAAELEAAVGTSDGTVTIAEASRLGGYSVDHLQRLVATHKLDNVGRKHRPRIRRGDVPQKPGYLPPALEDGHFSDRRRIVASSLTEKL